MSTTLSPIGSPPADVLDWLERAARSNDETAAETLLPWNRRKYEGQAWAFRTAAEWVRQALGADRIG